MRPRLVGFMVWSGLLAGLWQGWPARAATLGPQPLAPEQVSRLEQGRVLIETTPDQDHVERVWAAEDIDAPPETVWRVMTDCSEALHYVPRLKACEVIETDPDGRWDVRRHKLGSFPFFPDIKAVFRLDYERPNAMRFRQIAGDMSGSSGEWRLVALESGRRTRVFYTARLRLPSGVPGALARAVLRGEAPAALEGLRERSLATARRTAQ